MPAQWVAPEYTAHWRGPPWAEIAVLVSPPCSAVAGVTREECDLCLKLITETARASCSCQLGVSFPGGDLSSISASARRDYPSLPGKALTIVTVPHSVKSNALPLGDRPGPETGAPGAQGLQNGHIGCWCSNRSPAAVSFDRPQAWNTGQPRYCCGEGPDSGELGSSLGETQSRHLAQ